MIDQSSLTQWSQVVPWLNPEYVEQDLIISRALIDLFSHPLLAKSLAFRGGTALQKCFYKNPTRYSEDIDLVQREAGPIGPIMDGFREVLEPWLGKPRRKFSQGRATALYRFESTATDPVRLKLKVEINTTENFSVFGLKRVPFSVSSPWYTGETEIVTYSIEELLGTKLRALFQRKKGRDLYDLAMALKELSFDVEKVIHCFIHYMNWMGLKVSRAEFEQNLLKKRQMSMFREDMSSLLAVGETYDFEESFQLVWENIITRIPGEPWKKTEEQL